MAPIISIVIATYQRETLLQILLDSVLDQSVLPGNYEVVVVDNASSPHKPTQELCQSPRYNLLNMKCVHNPVLGLSQARNFGMRYTTGPWVAFLDDDEKIPLHWVERAIEITEKYAPDFFGGPYHPVHLEPKPAWFKDRYLSRTLGAKKGWLENGEFLFGGNLVIKREWLDQLKGFSTDLGRRGSTIDYGEDNELQLRAQRLGAKIYYDSELYVFHHVLPRQITPGWFITSAWYQGKANAKLFNAEDRKGKSSIAYTFKQLINSVVQAFYVAGLYLYLPFRNKKATAFRENYLVEILSPAVSEFSKSWHSFLLSFRKAA